MSQDRGQWTSASQAAYDLLCPGRHQAQRGLPDNKSDEAESGTRIHAWLASPRNGFLSDDEQEVANACLRRMGEIVSEWSNASAYETFIEERLWCAVQQVQHSGQPDVVLIQGAHALILDWKTGRMDVPEPNTNQQLRDLAVLASMRWIVANITVAIVQPFAKRQPPCVYDQSDLARALKDMRNRVLMSNNPMAPRVAGETQCKYCKASKNCPEYDTWTKGALPVLANSFGIEHAWTPEQWVNFLSLVPEAEKWIEAKKQEAKALLQANPEAIPGYTLKTIEREKIVNAQAVFNQAVGRGVNSEELMRHVSITKKGLKESLRTTGLKGKELESTMDEILFGNVETKTTDPLIAKAKE